MESIKYFINILETNCSSTSFERKELEGKEGCAFCSKRLNEMVFLLGVLNPNTEETMVTSFCKNCINNFEHVIKNIFKFEQAKDSAIKQSSKFINYFVNEVVENEQ